MPEGKQVFSALIESESTLTKPMEIVYCLTKGLAGTDGCNAVQSFGIETQMRAEGRLIDKCRVDDVSCIQEDVLSLIHVLAANSVTPVALHDVVEDWLGR